MQTNCNASYAHFVKIQEKEKARSKKAYEKKLNLKKSLNSATADEIHEFSKINGFADKHILLLISFQIHTLYQ